ncbi:MAG: galactokinase [Rikenellaceae bacterium]|nr:galactokinase [Rikenellaceae bacterium]
MNDKNVIKQKFVELYGAEPEMFASPGRINLIGEHTDYNGGFVFPGAVDKGITAAIRLNGTDKVRAYAMDLGESTEFGLNEEDKPSQMWACYVFGVCREIQKRGGKIGGFDTVFSGDVPLGAGMSSSAALESTFAFALNEFYNLGFEKFELARIGQSTEHNYCGVNCGIMDQFASVCGKAGHLMRLDCRSMEFEYFPFDPAKHGYRLVLVNSCVKHELVGSPYNDRRASCERVAKVLGQEFLRGASMEQLEAIKDQISEEDYMRARYVIGEEQRVLDVCAALEQGDLETVGARMYETHWGMSKDYEVSCEELDFLAEVAKECGVSGSRIMGGGFGGCTINLVKEELYDNFIKTATEKFAAKYGHEPKVYPVIISDGARRI